MTTAVVAGSLRDVSNKSGGSVAESFLSADALVVVDVSGSMATEDSRGNRSRYDVACDELARLQNSMPGKVGVVAFSDLVEFCPGGVPVFLGGGTDLAAALAFVRVADNTGMQFIVISDGEPQEPQEALRVARSFHDQISTVYVGPEGGEGARFLAQLAKAAGGQHVTADRAKELSQSISTLMLTGKAAQ